MKLNDLTGLHVLTGVDKDSTEVKQWDGFELAQCIRFVLDGICYVATEDPNDGYRSTMEEIAVSSVPIKTQFPPVNVFGVMKDGNNETIMFLNTSTGKKVLEVGTDNIDDYYPWYVAEFYPENL